MSTPNLARGAKGVDERIAPLVNALKFEVSVNCSFADLSILSAQQLRAFMSGIGMIAAANNTEKP